MRGALNDALRAALEPPLIEPVRSDISSALYAVARDCRWQLGAVEWRGVRSFHRCPTKTTSGAINILIGADASFLALANVPNLGEFFRFHDNAAFSTAAAGYASTMRVLLADDLHRELMEADRDWLISLGGEMEYNLDYWRPRTAGEVIFNFWD